MLAPIAPFITEEIWHRVIRPGDARLPESVHLTTWPEHDATLLDSALSDQVRSARALTEAGRAARKTAGLRIRQPLARAFVGLASGEQLSSELYADIAAELNLKSLEPLASTGELLDVTVKANFRALGKRFGNRTQLVATAVHAADPVALVQRLRSTGGATVTVDGEEIALVPDEVLVTEAPRSGWIVETQRGATIALDTTLTPELEAEGIARDVIRLVQQARREAGFEVSDHIHLAVGSADEILSAVRSHHDFLSQETLADEVVLQSYVEAGYSGNAGADLPVTVSVRRVGES
ncbi:DUF5915 domain-containing protein [Catellatospora sichuanensis]|uniref:DUF5915 domain-containing protein n=1 Tax=Catellatospora sichuanensis TaxID=1969805 RepID=UPI003CCC7D05